MPSASSDQFNVRYAGLWPLDPDRSGYLTSSTGGAPGAPGGPLLLDFKSGRIGADVYLRGLDRYVVDGAAGGVLRNTLFRELFNFNIPITGSASHDHIPIRIYATAFTDYGYAYNRDFKDNSLVNRMLYTGGFGIDLVTFYDLSFKLDYSFNQLGQNGLFLHIRNDF